MRYVAGLIVLGSLLLGACATKRGETMPDSVHQHLVSPAIAAIWSAPILPTVALPAPLADFIARREAAYGRAEALMRLYAEDAVLLSRGPAFKRGRDEIAKELAGLFSGPYRIAPVSYRLESREGEIAGYLYRDGKDPFGHILITLRQDGGTWHATTEALALGGPAIVKPMDADDLITQLDIAGIRRAVVLSVAYVFGDPRRAMADQLPKVRAENDWTAAEAARYPGRLFAFCGFSPLADYALDELARCAADGRFHGIKLHLGNSGVDLRKPGHVAKLAAVFASANAHGLPILIHMRTRDHYGRPDAEIFLRDVLPKAPSIPVMIAHLAGTGPGYWEDQDEAMAVFVEAIAAKNASTANLLFDVATSVTMDSPPEKAALVAQRIREVGPERIFFGADLSIGGNPPPLQAWLAFRGLTPLTEAEFQIIEGNEAPFFE